MEAGYRQLDVWQKSMILAESVYEVCRNLPGEDRFGLVQQLQRAVVSIPSNIAEGYGRGGGDYRRHVRIARGSLMEVETQLELTVRLKPIEQEEIVECWHLS